MNTTTLILLAALVIAALVSWRRGARVAAAGCSLAAVLPALAIARHLPWWGFVVAAILLAAAVWQRFTRTSATVTRWGARSRRKAGVASTLDVARFAGTHAMRRRAGTVRPSLAAWSCRQRLLGMRTADVAG